MSAPSVVPVQLWRGLIEAGGADERPWLIVPRSPCENDQHETVSYAELARVTERLGGALRARGCEPGDRVVVVADNSAEAALLLLAVLAAGLVAVPVSPRALGMQPARWRQRLRDVCEDCAPRFVVGRADRLPAPECPDAVDALSFEDLSAVEAHGTLAAPATSPEALALIQYTSGTTGKPRGVELTHENLFHNIGAIGAAISVTRQDVVQTWLPLFHDMGLIGSLLFATCFRLPIVLMTPQAFLLRPEAWLWAISRFSVTCCAAPNSAYHTCATKIAEAKLQGLQLSSWRAALSGSELVHPATVRVFTERFAHHGFRETALLPVYGLAENTVATTFPSYGRAPKIHCVDRARLELEGRAVPCSPGNAARSRGVVSVGSSLRSQALRVVDSDSGRVVSERTVGVVEIRGRCVMRGYHRAEAATAAVLGPDGWLRTGDRGYLHQGELYLVGREREVINRGGRKYDAADVRLAVAEVPGVRAGHVAAFGVEDAGTGTENLIVMAETAVTDAGPRAQLETAIARAVQQMLGVRPDRVLLVGKGVIPQTTSGKVQHANARDAYRALSTVNVADRPRIEAVP